MEEQQEPEGVVYTVLSPIEGKVVSIKDVPDPAFSNGLIGEGIGIIPEKEEVYSPVEGSIVSVFETKHAILFEADYHIKVFIHIGIGSMRMQGRGFETHVKNGQKVDKLAPVLSVSLERLREGTDAIVSPVVISSLDEGYQMRIVASERVSVGDPIFEVIRTEPAQQVSS